MTNAVILTDWVSLICDSWPTNMACCIWNNVKFPQESKNRKPKVFND